MAHLNELNKWVVNGKFKVKRTYMDSIAENRKPPWRACGVTTKSPQEVSFVCGKSSKTNCRQRLGLQNGGFPVH